jgi:hypothetical protein
MLADSTVSTYGTILITSFPTLGAMRLDAINRGDVQSLVEGVGRVCRPTHRDEDDRSRAVIDAALGGRVPGAATAAAGDPSKPRKATVAPEVSTVEPQ